jgi:glutathione S-transferase
MVKLYYTTTSCGAASFLAASLAGVNIESEQVDIRSHKTRDGGDYYSVNPKGNVPCLVLDDGKILNEGAAVLQFIADRNPGTIAPEYGTTERYLVQNALNYIASEVHPNIGGLFYPNSEEVKSYIKSRAMTKLEYLEKVLLADKQYLVGNSVSIADCYLYIVLSWCPMVGIDITSFPRVKSYYERIDSMEKVREAHSRMATNPSSTMSI